jgi:hypothetical protein
MWRRTFRASAASPTASANSLGTRMVNWMAKYDDSGRRNGRLQPLQLLPPNVCTPVLYMFEYANTTTVWEEINEWMILMTFYDIDKFYVKLEIMRKYKNAQKT